MTRAAFVRLMATVTLFAAPAIGCNQHALAMVNTASEWHFKVLLDDKAIGYHRFTLNDIGEAKELTSEARFNVKFLFFTAYRYTHDAKEVWRDQCLTQIDASTDDNGTKKTVHGAPTDGRFVVTSSGPVVSVDECVMTFAYWNPSILDATRLLNPQTGEYVRVQIARMGAESVSVRGASQPAERFRLTGKAISGESLQIDLWYSPTKEWLALESMTPDGRRLRYQIQ